jgi:hypothetical protein
MDSDLNQGLVIADQQRSQFTNPLRTSQLIEPLLKLFRQRRDDLE